MTAAVLVICCLMYIPVYVLPIDALDVDKAILFGAYYRPFVLAGEVWRLLTMGFVHGSFLHLAVNMFSMYNLGMALERLYGHIRFALILLLSVIGGGLLLLSGSTSVLAVGLSGGLYGLVAAYIASLWIRGILNDPYVRRSILNLVLINLAINFMPNVSAIGHLGGFLTGGLLGIALNPDLDNRVLARNCVMSAVLLFALMGYRGFTREYSRTDIYLGTDTDVLSLYRKYGLSAHAHHMAERLDVLYNIQYLQNLY